MRARSMERRYRGIKWPGYPRRQVIRIGAHTRRAMRRVIHAVMVRPQSVCVAWQAEGSDDRPGGKCVDVLAERVVRDPCCVLRIPSCSAREKPEERIGSTGSLGLKGSILQPQCVLGSGRVQGLQAISIRRLRTMAEKGAERLVQKGGERSEAGDTACACVRRA